MLRCDKEYLLLNGNKQFCGHSWDEHDDGFACLHAGCGCGHKLGLDYFFTKRGAYYLFGFEKEGMNK